MKNEILLSKDDPDGLEVLYRKDKAGFTQAFNLLYPQIRSCPAGQFWRARLAPPTKQRQAARPEYLYWILMLGILVALFAKIPDLFSLDTEYFYSRHIGFIVFPAFAVYMTIKRQLSFRKRVFIGLSICLGLLYMNLLPGTVQSDTWVLVCMHFPLLLWGLTGYVYMGDVGTRKERMAYLKFNGDWILMTGLVCLAGGILSGITIGLFALIDMDIEHLYARYIAIPGLSILPLLSGYLVERNPGLVGKIAPIIAKLFSPLALLVLVAFLSSMLFTGKDPYRDREFLLIFNLVLLAVMALIFFSVVGTEKTMNRFEIWILTALSLMTVIINVIALSAIGFRITEWGFTPNRTAVLGSNILMLLHLVWICGSWISAVRKKAQVYRVGQVIAGYLPIYLIWAGVVSFLFPLIFGLD